MTLVRAVPHYTSRSTVAHPSTTCFTNWKFCMILRSVWDVIPWTWPRKVSRLGSRARKIRRMADGMKLVMKPFTTGRLATVFKPGVDSSLLTCSPGLRINKGWSKTNRAWACLLP